MSWADALTAAADAMAGVPAAQVGAFAGPLVEVEALVCLKELLNSNPNPNPNPNPDSYPNPTPNPNPNPYPNPNPSQELLNSLGSTSTSSTAAGGQSADLRAAYLLNPTLAGIEAADALLMVGTNPRVEAPLLNSRLRRMVLHAHPNPNPSPSPNPNPSPSPHPHPTQVLHADVPVGVVGPKVG